MAIAYAQEGFVHILINPVVKTKIQIYKGNHIDTYTLVQNREQNVFPLQYGDGTYIVKVYQNTKGNTYKLAYTEYIAAKNTTNCYLGPCQYVWYSEEVQALSEQINASNPKDKLTAYYQYCYKKIYYDHIFALTNKNKDYVPDLKTVISKHRGVCFDKAALLCALCRINGIECRLAIGVVTGIGNHAWCQVKVDGTWKTVDPTAGSGKYKANDYRVDRMC